MDIKVKTVKVKTKNGRIYTYNYPIGIKTLRKKTEHHPEFKYNDKRIIVKHRAYYGFAAIKLMCLERDNFICQICFKKGGKLNIHHKDGVGYACTSHPNNGLDNLISVHQSCHMKLHYGVEQKHEDIKALYLTGKITLEEIGKQYNISRQRVQQILSKYGIGRETRK